MSKEYCELCEIPLEEWEWSGRGFCEACEDAMELGTEVVGRDGDSVFVVADRWVPKAGYEARTLHRIDGNTGKIVLQITQLRKIGEADWSKLNPSTQAF